MSTKEIVRHLLKYGNCYSVNDITNAEIQQIESQCGFKVIKRIAKTCELGYVLERVSDNVSKRN